MAQNRSIARILGIVQQRAEQISLPRVSNRLGLAALGVASLGVGAALTRLRPTDRSGRSERFQALIEDALEQSAQPWVCTSCQVQVNEGFGKPTMVSFSINMEEKQPIDDDRVDCARKLLEAVVRAVWKNPEIAPIGIQGRMSVNGEDTVDMQDLGYSALQVRPEELFERLGSPAIDRGWTPA